jgi:hypothetical protein
MHHVRATVKLDSGGEFALTPLDSSGVVDITTPQKLHTIISSLVIIASVLISLAVYIRTRGITYSLCIVLAAIGIFRLTYVAVHDPVIGYANNFDLLRLESCVDLWPPSRNSSIVCWPPWTTSTNTPWFTPGPISSTWPPDMIRTSKTMI